MSTLSLAGLTTAVTSSGPFAVTAAAPATPTLPATTNGPAEPATVAPTPTPTPTTVTATTDPMTVPASPSTTPPPLPTTTIPLSQPAPAGLIDAVTVVGDSLTVGVTGLVEPLLAGLHVPVSVDGMNGRRTAAGVNVVEGLALTTRSVVVVALGTNDPPEPTAFQALIDDMVTAARGAHLIWLTIDRDGYSPLNDALYAAAQQAPATFTVADWATYRAGHPEWGSGDGIHYTRDGYVARAQFIADVVRTATS